MRPAPGLKIKCGQPTGVVFQSGSESIWLLILLFFLLLSHDDCPSSTRLSEVGTR